MQAPVLSLILGYAALRSLSIMAMQPTHITAIAPPLPAYAGFVSSLHYSANAAYYSSTIIVHAAYTAYLFYGYRSHL